MLVIVNNDMQKYRTLQNIEKIVRKQGAIPIALGMINGNV